MPRFREEPIAPLLGGLLEETVRDAPTTAWSTWRSTSCTAGWSRTPETVAEILGERAPWWAPPRLNEAVISRLHRELVRWVADIRADPHHEARQALDSMLAQLAQDLLHDPDTQERAERLKERLLDHPPVIPSSVSLWNALRRSLRPRWSTPTARSGCGCSEVSAFAERLVSDAELRAGWTASPPTRPSSSSSATAPRSPR